MVITKPHLIFICSYNSIRSPMAAAIARTTRLGDIYTISSAGVVASIEVDPFVIQTLQQHNVAFEQHFPQDFQEIVPFLDDKDWVIALSDRAYDYAQTHLQKYHIRVDFWPIQTPPDMDVSRSVRQMYFNDLHNILLKRFSDITTH